MTRESLTHRAGRLRRPKVVLAVALVALAVILAGCLQIVSLTIPTDIESPPTMTITAEVKITVNMTNTRPVIAFRYPVGWTIVSISYTGDHAGDFIRSATMVDYYAGTWEATAPDKSHNGHKAGYEWWVGYGSIHTFAVDDTMTVTITVQPDRTHGDFLLDFGSGLTDKDNPTNPAVNGGGSNWEAGGIYDHSDPTKEPPGTALDQPCTLLPSEDPSVLSTTPADGATNVALATDPKVKFSEAMDAATMTTAKLFVRPTGGGAAGLGLLQRDHPRGHHRPQQPLGIRHRLRDLRRSVGQGPGRLPHDRRLRRRLHHRRRGSGSRSDRAIPGRRQHRRAARRDPLRRLRPGHGCGDHHRRQLQSEGVGRLHERAGRGHLRCGDERFAYLDPTGDLAPGTTYQVTLTTGVKGTNGLSVAGAPLTWTFTTETPISFLDVPPGHPYHNAILGLAGMGIVSGYPVSGGTEFRPANPVWRAQFAKMIDGTLELAVTEDMALPPFTDLGVDILVPSPGVDNLYPHEYVAAAYDHSITTGITPTTFAPYSDISRAQVVTMVVRAVQALHPTLLTPPAAGYANTWGTSFSDIHGPNARIAESNGLLAGLPLTGAASDPWAPMPRGEVAQVLWNVVEMLP